METNDPCTYICIMQLAKWYTQNAVLLIKSLNNVGTDTQQTHRQKYFRETYKTK